MNLLGEERFDESQFSEREKQWMAERDTLRHSMAASSSSPNLTKDSTCDTFDVTATEQNGRPGLRYLFYYYFSWH